MNDEPAVTEGVPTEAQQPALTAQQRQFLGVCAYLAALPRGPRAILRRAGATEAVVPPDAFWALVDQCHLAPADEAFWQSILPLLIACPHAWRRPGAALAEAGIAKSRVERWLRLDADRARREASRLLARLDSGLDWTEFGPLLYAWSDDQRRRLARQFFLSPALRDR